MTNESKSEIKNFVLSPTTRTEFNKQVDNLLSMNPNQKLYVNITEKKKKRSLPANAIQHVWYEQISVFTCTDIKTAAAECKIDFGLPIILKDEKVGPPISYALDKVGFQFMTREQQIKFIQVIQVTSLMSTKQHNQYRDNLIYFWNNAGLNIGYED